MTGSPDRTLSPREIPVPWWAPFGSHPP